MAGAILTWALIALDLHRAHTLAFHHAQKQLSSLASVYAGEASSSIEAINYVLVDLREEWENGPEKFDKLVQSRRYHLDPNVAFNVAIISAEGKLVFSTAVRNVWEVDLRDREHFRFHRLTEGDQLHISNPMMLRAIPQVAIQFSRPLPNKDGKFNGVIVVSVSPAYFSRLHEKIDLGADSVITLARTNGALIARSPRPGQAVDTTIEDVPWLRKQISESGFFQKYSELDQIERLYAWRVLERGDLAVVMGQSVKTILASYHQQRAAYLAGGMAVTLLLLTGYFLMRRHQLQRTRTNAEMQRMEQALGRSQKLESLGKLTGGVAHDFNNILQIISSTIQSLEMAGEGNEQIKPYLTSLADTSRHGKRLVSQLLTFARRQPLHPIAVHPQALVKDIDGLIQRLAGSGIEVKIDASQNTWNILADPGLLENVILNLAANARDAMNGHGTLKLSVSDERLDERQAAQYPGIDRGEYVLFSMSDTGCGMSAEVMEQAFEPFFTTKPEGKGTGLGLAAAYGFVKESGGYIHIESAPGNGTTIKVFLPRSSEKVIPASLPEISSTGGTGTILFVEDNPRLRSMTGMMLEHLGYRVLQAADSRQALAILKRDERIDILFTDIDMPGGINGIELARTARSICPDLTILLASGYDGWNGLMEATATTQEFPFLNKPYTAQEVHALLEKLMSQKEDELLSA